VFGNNREYRHRKKGTEVSIYGKCSKCGGETKDYTCGDCESRRRHEAERSIVILRAALEPFAKEAERRSWITNLSVASGMDDLNVGGTGLNNGDLRRALLAFNEAV